MARFDKCFQQLAYAAVGFTIAKYTNYRAEYKSVDLLQHIECLFVMQALFKQWRKLGLARAPRDALWMAMSIPLAPVIRFAESLEIVEAVTDRIRERYPSVDRFINYMRRQWLPLADIVTVGAAALRTNNICETFHRHIVARLGGSHPNIWRLVGAYLKIVTRCSQRQYFDHQGDLRYVNGQTFVMLQKNSMHSRGSAKLSGNR